MALHTQKYVDWQKSPCFKTHTEGRLKRRTRKTNGVFNQNNSNVHTRESRKMQVQQWQRSSRIDIGNENGYTVLVSTRLEGVPNFKAMSLIYGRS